MSEQIELVCTGYQVLSLKKNGRPLSRVFHVKDAAEAFAKLANGGKPGGDAYIAEVMRSGILAQGSKKIR